jgi:phage virion morphogenesis protein
MAGAGIEVSYDRAEFQKILEALEKASKPDKLGLARFIGEELHVVSNTAFESESDPSTGAKWKPLKSPRANGDTGPILQYRNHLHDSRSYIAKSDGAVYGTNLVYGAAHQEGGRTKAHEIRPTRAKALRFGGRFVKKVNHPGSDIPARPFMGIPGDFDRRLLSDPAVQRLLGISV